MEAFLSRDILDGINKGARRPSLRKARLCVHNSGEVFRIEELTDEGFTVAAGTPALRGHVEIFDGPRRVADCLIVRSEPVDGAVRYEFKRRTPALTAPAVDFVREGPEISGYITRG